MIKLQVIGHIGNDAVINEVNGKRVVNFNMAHSEKYRDGNGVQHEKTLWVQCAYWAEKVSVVQYLKRGTQIYAEGNPEVRTYQKNDGSFGASLTLRVFSIHLLGSKDKADGSRSQNYSASEAVQNNSSDGSRAMGNVDDDEELPF